MKKIENKVTTLDISDENRKAKYSDIAFNILNTPRQKGYSFSEQMIAVKIYEKLAKAGKEIDFEDAEFELLKSVLIEYRPVVVVPEVAKFIEYISKLS